MQDKYVLPMKPNLYVDYWFKKASGRIKAIICQRRKYKNDKPKQALNGQIF